MPPRTTSSAVVIASLRTPKKPMTILKSAGAWASGATGAGTAAAIAQAPRASASMERVCNTPFGFRDIGIWCVSSALRLLSGLVRYRSPARRSTQQTRRPGQVRSGQPGVQDPGPMLPGPVFNVELITTARRARYYAIRFGLGILLLFFVVQVAAPWNRS